MTLPSSGPISLGNLAAEFGGTAPHSLSEYYGGGGLVENTYKYIFYDQIHGDGGSPPINTKNPNSTSFSYSWHNRTFSGDQSGWGTSMVRETDQNVAYCKMSSVNVAQMGWQWTSGYNNYVQLPYYFTMKVVGNHATSSGGTTLTGTVYYTGTITRDDQSQGDASFSRRSGNPGDPGSTSVATGSTTEVEGGIGFLYDMIDCTVEVYFNAYEPNTSSATFRFYWGAGRAVNTTVPTSGALNLADFYGTENV
jgi:hypothetical protein